MMTNKVNAKMHRLITIAFILYGFDIDGQLGGIPEIEYFAVIYVKVNNHLLHFYCITINNIEIHSLFRYCMYVIIRYQQCKMTDTTLISHQLVLCL